MKIKFLGAAGTVTGSSYVLTTNSGQSIMIDLGMFQGPQRIDDLNYTHLDFDTSKLSGVLLTHAHLDHCGRLPLTLKGGYKGSIHMTPATRDLTELSLLDSAKIAKDDGRPILYDRKLAESTIDTFLTIDYDQDFVLGDFQIVYRDAGHILGSASIEILDTSTNRKIVFSGDLGNSPQPLIKSTQLIASGDIVIMESTYGDSNHPQEDVAGLLQSEINTVEKFGGTLLIPAFSLERSQELLHLIYHLKKSYLISVDTPIFLDSPMAEKATRIFEKYHHLFNTEFQNDYKHDDPFTFPGLTYVENREDSTILDLHAGPKVIIAGSGMMTGGRIVGHAAVLLSNPSTRLLQVGFQGEETLGRELSEGAKEVIIDAQSIKVQANITHTRAMSSHAGQDQLLAWLSHISGVSKLILTHGENTPRQILKQKILSDQKISEIFLPKLNDELII